MRALFILPSDLMGGSEYTSYKLVNHIINDLNGSVDVVFLSRRENGPSKWDDLSNANFIRMPSSKESIGAFLFLVFCIFNLRNKYSFVFSTHTHTNAFASILCFFKLLNVEKIILRESTNVFSWFSGFKLSIIKLFYIFYSSQALLVFQTEKMYKEFTQNVIRLSKNRFLILKNPVDFESLTKLSYEFEPCFVNNSSLTIVSVGRLVKEKGYDYLLYAVSRFDFDFELFIVGGGPLESYLKVLSQQLGIQDKVHFLGAKKNPFPFMRFSDVCVLSSIFEGFPNVLYEMMFLSNKIVSTECADGIDKIPGIVTCKSGCVDSLFNSIKSSIDSSDSSVIYNSRLRMEYLKNLGVDVYLNQLLSK